MSGGGMEQRRIPASYWKSIQPKRVGSLKGLTDEEYKEHLKKRPHDLRMLPKAKRTQELCMFTMTHLGYSDVETWVKEVPDDFPYFNPALYTESVCLAFFMTDYVERNRRYGDWSKGISYSGSKSVEQLPFKYYMKWESVCKAAVSKCGLLLNGVPSRIITQDLCNLAVNRSPMALQYVPLKYLNREMCLRIIMKEPYTIKFIPEEFWDKEILTYISENPRIRQYVPVESLKKMESNTLL